MPGKTMKVLLLGARGMLGQALQKVLANEKVTAWDKEELDITNQTQVRARISAEKPDVIINAAAYTAVDAAEEKKDLAFAVNEQGVRNVAQAAKEVEATLVHFSTDYVFPSFAKASESEARLWNSQGQFLGFPEDYPPGPAVNVYGESKLAGEKALQEIAPRFYLVRTAWLYGAGGKNFVDTIARLAEVKPELRVVNDQYGSPTYTTDLAEVTWRLLNSSLAPGIYHLVNSGVATWYDVAQAVVDRLGKTISVRPIPSSEYPLPARRPRYSVLRTAKNLPLRAWQEALKEYITEKYDHNF